MKEILLIVVGVVTGIIIGISSCADCIKNDIEQFNSIRINGVWYYPEGSGENDK